MAQGLTGPTGRRTPATTLAEPAGRDLSSWALAAYERSPLGIAFVTPDRRIVDGNPALARIFAQPIEELHGVDFGSLTHPDDRHLHQHLHQSLLAGEIDHYTHDKRCLRPDGTVIWVALHASIAPDEVGRATALIYQCEDITKVRAARADLVQERSRFAALVERSSDLIILLGSDGRLTYASPAAETLWGYAPSQIVDRGFGDFVHPDDIESVMRTFRRARRAAGAPIPIHCRVANASGAWRHVEATATNWIHDASVNGMVINIRDVTDRVEATEKVTWLAYHDALTGLANRALLIERINEAFDRSTRSGQPPALLYIDLDHFKEINDEYGHETGDRLLAAMGSRLRAMLRPTDTGARLGGDEFVVLVEDLGQEGDVTKLADRIATELARPVALPEGRGAGEISTTASIGIAFATSEPDPDDIDGDSSELIDQADRALYQAKRNGRARSEVFRPAT